jgi:transcriptional regulator with XRE-family HTH domain
LWGIRRGAGITIKDLAKRLGYHWTTLSRWENGHKIPGFLALHDWCDALGVRLTTSEK